MICRGAFPCQDHLEREGGGGQSAALTPQCPTSPPTATLQILGWTLGQWPSRSTFFQFAFRPCRDCLQP